MSENPLFRACKLCHSALVCSNSHHHILEEPPFSLDPARPSSVAACMESVPYGDIPNAVLLPTHHPWMYCSSETCRISPQAIRSSSTVLGVTFPWKAAVTLWAVQKKKVSRTPRIPSRFEVLDTIPRDIRMLRILRVEADPNLLVLY